ncbi:MAG: hypothetical protein M0P70_09070 [Desulfobulbaceae bacterium]|nr:hypothetical protein [Desulfobulbaceae bacterium]
MDLIDAIIFILNSGVKLGQDVPADIFARTQLMGLARILLEERFIIIKMKEQKLFNKYPIKE